MSVWAELECIVSNNQFYKNGLAPRNAKVLKCTLVVDEGIVAATALILLKSFNSQILILTGDILETLFTVIVISKLEVYMR